MANSGWLARGAGCAATGVALAFALQMTVSGALAQQPKAQPKGQPPAAAQKKAPEKAAEKSKPSAWVKLCEKADLVHKTKDGKEEREQKNICLTHHERLDGNTGMVLVSAAIREVEGMEKQHLMIMVPLGMAIPPGVKAAVYSKEQWEKAQKNEKIDDKQLKPIDLKYSLCHPGGCTAEVEASKDLVESMKTGGGIMVLAINANAQAIAFPVPLDGFTAAHTGAPVDNKAYEQARGELMKQIRQRQAELIKQHQEKQKEKQGAPAAKK